jgi:hypothetical protein
VKPIKSTRPGPPPRQRCMEPGCGQLVYTLYCDQHAPPDRRVWATRNDGVEEIRRMRESGFAVHGISKIHHLRKLEET